MTLHGWESVEPTGREWESAHDVDKAAALELAVHTLWVLTGRVLGTLPAAVRPSFGAPAHRSAYRGNGGHREGWWWPGLISGTGAVGSCGCTTESCGCNAPNRLMLPGPVASITQVMIDGVVVPPSAYRVENLRSLMRVDGGVWPQTQDFTAPDDAVGAFTVTYERGLVVPPAGLVAAADLAIEFLRARSDKPCKIPQRAQSVTRQGIDIQMIDPYTMFEQGLTGVPSVDQWITAVNPNRNRARSKVYSVDAPRMSRLR